jgi:5-methylcytosine-specific restriction enzyme A
MLNYITHLTADRDRWHDTRRRIEPLWRPWCKSPTWKSISRHRLAEEPRCRQIEGRAAAAIYVDHVRPHLGQRSLFFKYENAQSLCAHHHNMHTRQEKRGNFTQSPTDPSAPDKSSEGQAHFSGKREGKGARLDSVRGLEVTMGTGRAGLTTAGDRFTGRSRWQ